MEKEFLYDLMAEFEKRNIHELSFESKEGSIRLVKAPEFLQPPAVVATAPVLLPETVTEPALGVGTEIIKAPIVGNFYRQPAADAPYFVNEGDRVRKGQTICILEAMKSMNELPAEFDCEIVRVLVENGVMVEFDTALFEVKRL